MKGGPTVDDVERRKARNARNHKWRTSTEKGRAYAKRKNQSPAARAAAVRYRTSDKYRARRAARVASGAAASYEAEYRRKVRLQHPERMKARLAMNWGVKSGFLVRPDACSNCGSTRPIEGHHHLGYEREHWFDVTWLCRPCHRGIHQRTDD